MKQNLKLIIPVIFLAGAIALAARFLAPGYTYKGSVIDPALPASDFTLTNQDGQPFHLGDQRGKIVLLFFGYTNCPDVCPTTLAQYIQIKRGLKELASGVVFAFVTVDPERDTPAVIQNHLSHFDREFVGLTGSQAELQPIWKNYFISVEKEDTGSASGYMVSHTARTFVVNPQGELFMTYAYGTPTENMVSDLKHMLKEQQP